MMGRNKREVTWNHGSITLHVGGVSLEATVLRCGEIDVTRADLVPDFLCVARRSVAVEVPEVMVDLIQVALLGPEVR